MKFWLRTILLAGVFGGCLAAMAAAPVAGPQTASSTSSASASSFIIKSVSIKDSPGVPDTGGHSVIGGLLRGSLTAVEPNLILCVTPAGGRRTCTGVCPPGHDCTQRLGGGIRINGANPAVHLEVMDNDGQGHITSLGAADFADSTMCTQSQPCMHIFPDPTSPDPANGTNSTIYFDFGTTANLAQPSGAGPATSTPASTTTAPARLPASTSTSGSSAAPKGCHGPYLSIEDAMTKDSNGVDALNLTGDGDTEYGYIIERDPSFLSKPTGAGGYYTTPPVKGSASTMDIDDYVSSYDLCPQFSSYQFVATVHTHPVIYSLLKEYLNFNMNQNFSPSDFTQSVQAKINKTRTWWDSVTDFFGDECVPAQGASKFEKIVMIYVGDRRVRTFEPGEGDCTFSTLGKFFLNKEPYGNDKWGGYVTRTCIVPNVWSWTKQRCVPASQR